MNPTAPRFTIKGWHVLVGFVLFFAADIAINAVFMTAAYRTFPGQTSVTPYEDGLAYNRALAQERAQAARGWRLTAGVQGDGRLVVEAFDRTGRPLGDLHVVGRLRRPATEAGERIATFEQVAPGRYTASAGRLTGAWDLELTAFDQTGDRMLAERRLVQP